ncbi:hypothetical protein GG344DRAFT_59480 [Lentinula edodes]|nr:hypothetical protein GG344DRAFT_59480 [Lentinula edodes]
MALVIDKWCKSSSPVNFEEAGCAVCGQLTLCTDLSALKNMKNYLHVLEAQSVTRAFRSSPDELISEIEGPVLDKSAGDNICNNCRSSLRAGNVPKLALCRGLWLGVIPDELKGLTFYEKMLIARVRHTKCFVRVQKGSTNYSKLVSNVIAFENPIPKIYDTLPPPKEDIEEVLAVMFSGSTKPTQDDYARALLLVRRNVVAKALQILILNHFDYNDVVFSSANLESYAEDAPIVSVEYFQKDSNRNAEGISVHDDLNDDGTEEGDCVFTVHGIVGPSIKNMTRDQMVLLQCILTMKANLCGHHMLKILRVFEIILSCIQKCSLGFSLLVLEGLVLQILKLSQSLHILNSYFYIMTNAFNLTLIFH